MAHPEEIVDVVDDADAVLFQVMKKEAHEKGLLHRTVIGEIKDREGRWILVRQASDKQDRGQYVSPVGGHVTAGETEDDAFKREAEEECGISGFEFKLMGKKIYNRNILNRQENHYFIVYEIHTDQKITLNEESVDCKLFTEAELKDALKANPELFGAPFRFLIEAFYPSLLL